MKTYQEAQWEKRTIAWQNYVDAGYVCACDSLVDEGPDHVVDTDCCGVARPACETTSSEDVVVCARDYGCEPQARQADRDAEEREYERNFG